MATYQEDVTDPKTTTVLQEKNEEQFVSSEDILKGAQRRTDDEHSMSLREGFRKYPKACFWSMLFSSAVIMEGFDHAFVSAFFGFPAFQERYGTLVSPGNYQVSATLQAAIGNGVNAGQIIGLLVSGLFADWFGYRWIMMISLILIMAFVFLQFFATSIYMYLGAEILLGLPWGAFQVLTTTYAAEVCPTVLRPYLTMFVPLCWAIGYFIGTALLRGFLGMTGEWAYRIPFALQWALPIPIIIGIFFAPESPWWLTRKGRTEDAAKALRRLRTGDVTEEEIADTISMMVYTAKVEEEVSASSTYWDLFKGIDLRRTEITVFVYVIQELCAPLTAYIVYFLEQAGLPATEAFDFAMGEYALQISGIIVAWFVSPKVGRRTLVLWGTSFMVVTTFIIGFIGIGNTVENPVLAYAVGSILMVEYFFANMTIGPIIYTIVTEMPSNHLRTKSVVLARATYNIFVLAAGQLVPHMVQRVSWDWGAKSGFFFGGIMGIGLIWAFFRLPETKGRTFAEIDILFKNKVKARDFSKSKVDLATQSVSKE